MAASEPQHHISNWHELIQTKKIILIIKKCDCLDPNFDQVDTWLTTMLVLLVSQRQVRKPFLPGIQVSFSITPSSVMCFHEYSLESSSHPLSSCLFQVLQRSRPAAIPSESLRPCLHLTLTYFQILLETRQLIFCHHFTSLFQLVKHNLRTLRHCSSSSQTSMVYLIKYYVHSTSTLYKWGIIHM